MKLNLQRRISARRLSARYRYQGPTREEKTHRTIFARFDERPEDSSPQHDEPVAHRGGRNLAVHLERRYSGTGPAHDLGPGIVIQVLEGETPSRRQNAPEGATDSERGAKGTIRAGTSAQSIDANAVARLGKRREARSRSAYSSKDNPDLSPLKRTSRPRRRGLAAFSKSSARSLAPQGDESGCTSPERQIREMRTRQENCASSWPATPGCTRQRWWAHTLASDGTRPNGDGSGTPPTHRKRYPPETSRGTLCCVEQAGCVLDCSFCSTGKQGKTANSRPASYRSAGHGEQYLRAKKEEESSRSGEEGRRAAQLDKSIQRALISTTTRTAVRRRVTVSRDGRIPAWTRCAM